MYSVLLTRPINQNKKAEELIYELGGEAIVLPTVNIEPIVNAHFNIDTYLKTAYLIILISQNVVWTLPENWIESLKKYSNIFIITMGAATTGAAQARGLSIAYTAKAGFTSEQLLDIELLQEKDIHKKNILILTGEGGREVLNNTLESKGAFVKNISLYKRTCPEYTLLELQTAFQSWLEKTHKHKFIFITSQNGIENLLKIASGFEISLEEIPVIVPSVRVQNFVKSQGFAHVKVAASARDEDMIDTMLHY